MPADWLGLAGERGTARRPETMLVMGEKWLRTQFGAEELARLASATAP